MARDPGLPEAADELGKWLKAIHVHLQGLSAWTSEVTGMLREIDWSSLAKDYGRKPHTAGDPPQQPPPWPPK